MCAYSIGERGGFCVGKGENGMSVSEVACKSKKKEKTTSQRNL